jgi:DNA primase
MNTAQAKQIRITDYLNDAGFRPARIQGDDFWYCSPFRRETMPSFKVNDRANVWYDHGLGQGGNIIDLVLAMYRLETVSQALAKLSDKTQFPPAASFSFQQQKVSSGIEVVKITPLSNSALTEHIKSRHIDIEIAKRYCKDVYYTVNGKNYFSVGFRNDCGGYELSNPYFKGSVSPKNITTFRNNSDTCLVFEGFWDFLSYLTFQKIEKTRHDAIVLNSVANVQKAMDFLKSHREVFACLDNDEAGRKATEQIKSVCVSVNDLSGRYAGYKDLNDYLCGKKQVQEKKKTRGFKL